MCFETTARPPLPPIGGGAGIAGSERLVLEASDGNRFNAFSVRANAPDAPGIMILPDVRGLHPFYEELATRYGIPLVPFVLMKIMTDASLMQSDRAHPNQAGARAIADLVWPYLQPLLKKAE
jgi:lysophospholipase L1-like esterase